MAIVPSGVTKFLGLSTVGFNCSLGWGGETSNLNVTLVKDTNDTFTSPLAGTPVQFSFPGSGLDESWRFGGIIQKHTYSQGQNGRLYNVTVTDPREVLQGVCLVLNSFNGDVSGVPNLVNCYAYQESFGFGNSLSNDTGMPWKKVRDSVTAITNTGKTNIYGGPITLYNWGYYINLSGLPDIPNDYRIGGDNITLLDFIDEVCQAGACDYFFTLQPGDFITLNTIPRSNIPTLGLISTWINSLSGVVSSETGLEFRNEVAGKFVVGGNRQDMYFQTYNSGEPDDYSDDTIWPYWGYIQPGFDNAGDLILGQRFNNEHTFTVDARHLNLNFPGVVVDTYTMCVGELRASLDSQNTWESYLWFRDNENLDVPIGISGHTPTSQLYKERATKLKIIGNLNSDISDFLLQNKTFVSNQQAGFSKQQIEESSLSWQTKHEEDIKRLYDMVHSYASEYYGQKFMVRIPNVQSRVDVDTGFVSFSMEPVSHGYLDESIWPSAIYYNYLPHDINPLLNEDGLIQAYARYDNAAYRDFSEISPSEIVFNSGGTSAFVKCDVEQGVGFIDWPTKFSPRAIVNTRGAVRTKVTGSGTSFGGVFTDLINEMIKTFGTLNSGDLNFITSQFNADQLCLENKGFIVQPDMIAVPLLSNTQRYGPWKAVGANGKCEFEVDDTLVPWKYNGYPGMNIVGSGKVSQAFSNMLWAETGSVEVPGAPEVNLGSAVVAGGPYVTDINVSIDPQAGVTTRYNLSTWSPRFGAANKLREQRIQKVANFAQKQKRWNRTVIRKAQQQRPPMDANGFIIQQERTPRKQAKSTHTMIVGENIPKREGATSGYYSNVGFQPGYLTAAQLHPDEYNNKAAASLDTLFRPFSTHYHQQGLVDASGFILPLSSGYTLQASGFRLPHYYIPASGAEFPTLTDLNPFQSGCDFGVLTRGHEYPSNLSIQEGGYDPSGNYRSMGHTFPMIGVGWGYDINGKPVPNIFDPLLNPSGFAASGLGNQFYPGYLSHPEYWKAAPVDIRYDYDRGIWVAGGGSNNKIVKIVNSVDVSGFSYFPTSFRSVYRGQIHTPTFIAGLSPSGFSVSYKTVQLTETSQFINVGNYRNNIVISGQYYDVTKINGQYYLDNQIVFL